jgi:hypothetical protein
LNNGTIFELRVVSYEFRVNGVEVDGLGGGFHAPLLHEDVFEGFFVLGFLEVDDGGYGPWMAVADFFHRVAVKVAEIFFLECGRAAAAAGSEDVTALEAGFCGVGHAWVPPGGILAKSR